MDRRIIRRFWPCGRQGQKEDARYTARSSLEKAIISPRRFASTCALELNPAWGKALERMEKEAIQEDDEGKTVGLKNV